MIRVLACCDNLHWAYSKRAQALQKHQPEDIRIDIATNAEIGQPCKQRPGALKYPWPAFADFDVCFLLEYAHAGFYRSMFRKHGITTPLVVSYNSDGRRRQELWSQVYKAADFVIANNFEAWDVYGRLAKTCNISNGVDCEIYRPAVPITERPKACCWCGSSGPLKGKGWQQIFEPLAPRLAALGIGADFRPIDSVEDQTTGERLAHVKSTEQQAAWYNNHSVVLCASLSEGTPNYLLEAAASGCVPVSVPVGNLLEFGQHGRNCVFVERTVRCFLRGIQYAMQSRQSLSEQVVRSMADWDWSKRAQWFYAAWRALSAGQVPNPFTYRDTPADALS